MPWVLYAVPTTKRSELDAALKDDLVSRQSHKVRDATTVGGPKETTYVLIEGGAEGVRRATELFHPLGQRLEGAEGEALYQRFKAEEDAASAGMGLFFTEE